MSSSNNEKYELRRSEELDGMPDYGSTDGVDFGSTADLVNNEVGQSENLNRVLWSHIMNNIECYQMIKVID